MKSHPEIETVSIREDDGYSGVNFERPAFQQMLEDIRQGTVDCVVVKDLSRFGRNYIEVGRYLEKVFPMLGVRFIAVNDHYDSLETDAAGDIIVPFKNLINDSYCRDLSVKIRSNLAVKRKNGEYIGPFACYGYLKDEKRKGKLIVDPYAGQVVQDIFTLKLNGYSQYRIADLLNEQGILSPMEYKRSLGIRFSTTFKVNPKALWSAKAISRILTNEVYTGVLVQGKQTTPNYKVKTRQLVDPEDWVRVEGTHEAIIDRFTFEIVQTLLQRDTRTSEREDTVFPLAGLVYCGDCGSPMIRKTIHAKDASGQSKYTYSYYLCRQGKNCCGWHRIREDELLNAVYQAVNHHIQTLLSAQERKDVEESKTPDTILTRHYEAHIQQKREELERAQKLKASAYEDFREGLLEQEEYLNLKQMFSQRITEARQSIAGFERKIEEAGRSKPDAWIEHFRQFGNLKELTRLSAVATINRVLVYEQKKIKIIFNFEDAYQKALQLTQTETGEVG